MRVSVIAKEKNWKVISATQNINAISNEIKETLLKNLPNLKNDYLKMIIFS